MICGLKLTHDGAVAVVDRGALLTSIEIEKVEDNARHSPLRDLRLVAGQLRRLGLGPADIGHVAIDGWIGESEASLAITDDRGRRRNVGVAGYALGEVDGRIELGGRALPYHSRPHTVGHAFAGYCTSPFAAAGRAALVLVWDGGTGARLYEFDPRDRELRDHGIVLAVPGSIYPIFASLLEPFRDAMDWHASLSLQRDEIAQSFGEGPALRPLLDIPGKAMAYAGLGEVCPEALDILAGASRAGVAQPSPFLWSLRVLRRLQPLALADASLMATFQEFLFRQLAAGLTSVVSRVGVDGMPLCFAGGCALNIKFNSRLRSSGIFEDVWVPPFPNDSGSAIGAACAEMVRSTGQVSVDWSVFSGPELTMSSPTLAGWERRPCDVESLATLLHEEGEPVVVLDGPAELGPRALGHRSILAPATSGGIKDHLNAIKQREPYRPVAPVCLEDRAPEVFSPGTRDPYMLFDHVVRSSWRDRIPAVVHVDGTARLQTVGPDNRFLHRLLTEYERRSGVPVLCNTSANAKGCGFFPGVISALAWGRTRYVWSDGVLHVRTGEVARPAGLRALQVTR